MLTYESIRKIFNEEKNSNTLAKLPGTFFQEVKAYIAAKEKIRESKEDQWEASSARRIIQDLLDARDRKILTASLYYSRTGIIPENMTGEEKDFFDKAIRVIDSMKEYRKSLLDSGQKMSMVAMLSDIPQFVGIDMRNYGPYKEGDVATVPEENARVLSDKKAGKLIEAR